MAEHDFLVNLTKFANGSWPIMRLGHSVGAFDDKYPCANPEGPVDNSECSDNDPLCECPCPELNPFNENPEPTEEEIKESFESIKECDYIEDVLGGSWKGCIWKDKNHPSSCDCPCVGENFKKYIEYSRTYSTYWDTREETPLWRNAQMLLINSQMSIIKLRGDLSLRPGQLITLVGKSSNTEDKLKRYSGAWLVSDISHVIEGNQHNMMLKLIRDSSPIDPKNTEYVSFFEEVLGWLFG
tara:strand:- start:48 stop:767 length:720 start_codon:yes stop_codon:yes gene_type:complete